MDDLWEKVIRGLKCCSNRSTCDEDCPYWFIVNDPDMGMDECTSQLAKDALLLLKPQEAKKIRCIRHLTKVMKGICPTCEMEIESVRHGKITKFCKFCGQAVKWE